MKSTSLCLLALSLAAFAAPAQPIDAFSGNFAGVSERCDDATDWCHQNAPVGEKLSAVFALNDTDAWAVGAHGVTAHWDGSGWTFVETGVRADLAAVWGAATDDVWAVGAAGTILHWDGAAWSPTSAGTAQALTSISGSATDNVWMVGGSGAAVRWDGVHLYTIATGQTPVAVFALGPADVLVAGYGTCARWDGIAFRATACDIRGDGAAIWGTGPGDLWVVSMGSYHGDRWTDRAHWDGTAWTTTHWYQCDVCGGPGYPGQLRTISGSASNDVWINGTWHFDGASWTQLATIPQDSISATPTGLVFGVQGAGDLTLWSGARSTLASTRPDTRLAQVRGADAGDVWVVGRKGAVVRYDGTGWTALSDSTVPTFGLGAQGRMTFGSGSSDLFAYDGDLWHFDGGAWAQTPVAAQQQLFAGWSRTGTDAIVLGRAAPGFTNASWHWDGVGWSRNTIDFSPDSLFDGWGSAPDDVWLVGERRSGGQDAAWHWDGTNWTRQVPGSGLGLTAVFGNGPGDVWMLEVNRSYRTEVLHWNGVAWSDVGTLPVADAIASTSPFDVWTASSFSPGLFHFNGIGWRSVEQPWPNGTNSLWAITGVAMVAVSSDGGLYRRLVR